MTMSTLISTKSPRGRGPTDGSAFFERLWRGNFFLDRQKIVKRTRKRKLNIKNGNKRFNKTKFKQHCCCCQQIQLHLLAPRETNIKSVIRYLKQKLLLFLSQYPNKFYILLFFFFSIL